MIKAVSIFNNLQTKMSCGIKRCKSFFNYGTPKLKLLKKDVFELSSKNKPPEVLTYSPPIYSGAFDSGIDDPRFVVFETEYSAYNFEGFGNKFPNWYVCIDSYRNRRLKPHVFLKIVEIKPEFARQGIYKNAIKKLAETVKKDKECEGRIILSACKMESPDMTKIPSPSLAHWNCGFRFAKEENNKIMEKVLKGELPPESAPEDYMYYSLI